jgi:TPR repeat protein
MAFTDVETAQAHEAVIMDPTGEDLCKLGILYSTGQGGEIDYVEAHKWFNLAALMGSEPAKHYRQEISDQMSNGDIAAAQRAAREWLSTRH